MERSPHCTAEHISDHQGLVLPSSTHPDSSCSLPRSGPRLAVWTPWSGPCPNQHHVNPLHSLPHPKLGQEDREMGSSTELPLDEYVTQWPGSGEPSQCGWGPLGCPGQREGSALPQRLQICPSSHTAWSEGRGRAQAVAGLRSEFSPAQDPSAGSQTKAGAFIWEPALCLLIGARPHSQSGREVPAHGLFGASFCCQPRAHAPTTPQKEGLGGSPLP